MMFRSGILVALAVVYEATGHEWVGGALACPHRRYPVVITLYEGGRAVGELRAETCLRCDPGS